MRKSDIQECLQEVYVSIQELLELQQKALSSLDITELKRVKIKDCLANLKSCLDYLTVDIYETIFGPLVTGIKTPRQIEKEKEKLKFPYGNNETDFRAMCQGSFPNLSNLNRALYELIESIQPYKDSDNDWIVPLAKKNNHLKHNDLHKQERRDETEINIPGALSMQGSFEGFSMTNCIIDGVPTGDIHIPDSKNPASWINNGRHPILYRNTAEFYFSNSSINVMDLITKSYVAIESFFPKVYSILDNIK
jgi:hypothetical protein